MNATRVFRYLAVYLSYNLIFGTHLAWGQETHSDGSANTTSANTTSTQIQLEQAQADALRSAQQELNNQMANTGLEFDNQLAAAIAKENQAKDAGERCEIQSEMSALENKQQSDENKGNAIGQAAQGIAPAVGQAVEAIGKMGGQEKQIAQNRVNQIAEKADDPNYPLYLDGSKETGMLEPKQINWCKLQEAKPADQRGEYYESACTQGMNIRIYADQENNRLQRSQKDLAAGGNATSDLMGAGLGAIMGLLGPAMALNQGKKNDDTSKEMAELGEKDCKLTAKRALEDAQREKAMIQQAKDLAMRQLAQRYANLRAPQPGLNIPVENVPDEVVPGEGGPEAPKPQMPSFASAGGGGSGAGGGGAGGGGGGDSGGLGWTFGQGGGSSAGGKLPDNPPEAEYAASGGGSGYGYVDPTAGLFAGFDGSGARGSGVGALSGDGGLENMIQRSRNLIAANSQYFQRSLNPTRMPLAKESVKPTERSPSSAPTRY